MDLFPDKCEHSGSAIKTLALLKIKFLQYSLVILVNTLILC